MKKFLKAESINFLDVVGLLDNFCGMAGLRSNTTVFRITTV